MKEVPKLRNDCFSMPQGVDWTPVDEALTMLQDRLKTIVKTETISVEFSDGRISQQARGCGCAPVDLRRARRAPARPRLTVRAPPAPAAFMQSGCGLSCARRAESRRDKAIAFIFAFNNFASSARRASLCLIDSATTSANSFNSRPIMSESNLPAKPCKHSRNASQSALTCRSMLPPTDFLSSQTVLKEEANLASNSKATTPRTLF